MKQLLFSTLTALVIFIAGCKKDGAVIDTEYPVIDINFADAFPKQCSSITRGQTISFKARFSDNVQLGGYGIDIHHNFDHHSHSTEVNQCSTEPLKTALKPFVFIKSFDIPAGLKTYEASAELTIPMDIDPGDYHFLIRLTDKEGWQTIRGLSIKLQ
ncbi:DUF4625 domain-containing protein [Segetibacter sp. 3557_3]|uniref:DUF4625 domain-containing protein n=1 Tax=Segetibacter sp. 3557_3 TaxID=2547429 RepID=UPI001058C1F7|nr:DUF4625 domain-containing protein [Segetibacter sp. 3557_3]TDH26963.1 DUF4625 domain-containing protein [Segetibacter sp. 3557_3]